MVSNQIAISMNSNNDNPLGSSIESPYQRLIDYAVSDSTGSKIGHVHHVYVESDGQPLFLGIKTGWIFGRHYVVPVSSAQVNDAKETVKLPYTEAQIKDAPNFEEDADLLEADHLRLFSYYDVTQPASYSATPSASIPAKENMAESQTIKLKEEELKVGKRQVEAGGVRLRKIVRTEIVNQPVELQREEIVIERVAGNDAAATDDDFEEEDIYIPLRREEAVVEKTAHVREEVRVGKKTEVDRQTVQGELRKEDVQIDKDATRKPRS